MGFEFCLINKKSAMERTAGSGASAHAIIRASIHTFLKNYRYFSSVMILILLPYSALILVSRMRIVTTALSIQGLETITASTSVLQVAFALTFLVMAKSAVIRCLGKHPQDRMFLSFFKLCGGLLKTQIWNSFLAISVRLSVSVLFSIAQQSSSILKGFPQASNMLVPLLHDLDQSVSHKQHLSSHIRT
ncbi:hypothetical protein MLD38_001305 [Melastoma candidum]|uniref:Uncharacterized protein n=1 Tax=Melastoma candidum TaxID=119954 RepID=A0ACB9SC71_9MYRT|nr:hypothetical protein MLD38_001305 [Melastoma candidum]